MQGPRLIDNKGYNYMHGGHLNYQYKCLIVVYVMLLPIAKIH